MTTPATDEQISIWDYVGDKGAGIFLYDTDYKALRARLDQEIETRKRMEETLKLCRYSIANENHVSGDVARGWVKCIDEALAATASVPDAPAPKPAEGG